MDTEPGLIFPGQRIIAGTRNAFWTLIDRALKPAGRRDAPTTRLQAQPPALVLFIIASASSIVKVFGFWMIGNSLKVSANFCAIAIAP